MGDQVHWLSDPNRLMAPTPAMSGETRLYVKHITTQNAVRNRAFRAAVRRIPWEHGDTHPKRRGKPWPDYAREVYDWGLEEPADSQTQLANRIERITKKRLREQEAQRRQRQKVRRYRATKVAAFIAPVWTRRLRRWCGLTAMPRSPYARTRPSRRTGGPSGNRGGGPGRSRSSSGGRAQAT